MCDDARMCVPNSDVDESVAARYRHWRQGSAVCEGRVGATCNSLEIEMQWNVSGATPTLH
jgi:hypothetical protein